MSFGGNRKQEHDGWIGRCDFGLNPYANFCKAIREKDVTNKKVIDVSTRVFDVTEMDLVISSVFVCFQCCWWSLGWVGVCGGVGLESRPGGCSGPWETSQFCSLDVIIGSAWDIMCLD